MKPTPETKVQRTISLLREGVSVTGLIRPRDTITNLREVGRCGLAVGTLYKRKYNNRGSNEQVVACRTRHDCSDAFSNIVDPRRGSTTVYRGNIVVYIILVTRIEAS